LSGDEYARFSSDVSEEKGTLRGHSFRESRSSKTRVRYQWDGSSNQIESEDLRLDKVGLEWFDASVDMLQSDGKDSDGMI